ncbi:MAG: hypothetical protein WAW91_02550 [Candidatus Nanoperiomorbaceae bacterium]
MLLNNEYIEQLFTKYGLSSADVIENGVFDSGEFDELDYYIVRDKDRFLGFFSGIAGYDNEESQNYLVEHVAPNLGVSIARFIDEDDTFHVAEIKLLFNEKAYQNSNNG